MSARSPVLSLSPAISAEIRRDVLTRFLRYVTIDTTSRSAVTDFPSSPGQVDFARMLERELRDLGLGAVRRDRFGYVYARFPGRGASTAATLTLCAHMDTSEMESGRNVVPQCHVDYRGEALFFPDNAGLSLSADDSPELLDYLGDTIVTASGTTLLGADDKAGIAEIMTLLHILRAHPEWPCPELRLVFTPEEETGRGTLHLDSAELGASGFTLDIGRPGEINDECFDAWRAEIRIRGRAAHPGYARGRMCNAAQVAAFIAGRLPPDERPETTEERAGFYHLTRLSGTETEARLQIMLRDFDETVNRQRLAALRGIVAMAETVFPGAGIDLEGVHMYPNMKTCTRSMENLMKLAEQAFRNIGLEPCRRPLRGGTDGALMCRNGNAMANLGTGGMLAHSLKEWIALTALEQTCGGLLLLCALLGEKLSTKDGILQEDA